MFTSSTRPMPGKELKQTIERIEEMWSETEGGDKTEEVWRLMQQDLFEMVGVAKGLMIALELRSTEQPEKQS